MTDKIKQWLAVITGLLLLVALLLCAGCSTPQHEPTPSENPLASLDELDSATPSYYLKTAGSLTIRNIYRRRMGPSWRFPRVLF